MDQINTIALVDENVYPDNEVLQRVLGESYDAYCDMLKLFDANTMLYEWRYYKDGKAWLCKVQKKKRTIIWMSVWKGFIKATIYLPAKHIDDVYNLEIDEELKKKIKETKNVGTSKPCMFEIRDKDILKELETVMQYKINTK